MRQPALHITVALLAFTIGFLTADAYEQLTIALPVAFTVFVLIKGIIGLSLTRDHLKVVVITLIIWIPFAIFTLNMFMPPPFNCVVDFPEEEIKSFKGADKEDRLVAELNTDDYLGATICSCNSTNAVRPEVVISTGLLNEKTISKPAPRYPPLAKSTHITGTVVVSVIIDEAGKVIWAQAVTGHPLLRQAAMDAACQAGFSPTKVCGPPIYVNEILTYDFRL